MLRVSAEKFRIQYAAGNTYASIFATRMRVTVGADLCVRPESREMHCANSNPHTFLPRMGSCRICNDCPDCEGRHAGLPLHLRTDIDAEKLRTKTPASAEPCTAIFERSSQRGSSSCQNLAHLTGINTQCFSNIFIAHVFGVKLIHRSGNLGRCF